MIFIYFYRYTARLGIFLYSLKDIILILIIRIYTEEVDDDSAFAFGITEEEFDMRVENAVCVRQTVDSKGRELYVFEAESSSDALWLANALYDSYEFAPCDVAEKMTVACAGKYVMLFKSASAEIDGVVDCFRALSGGALRYRKDMDNRH